MTTLASGTRPGYALLANPNVRFRVRTIGSDVYLYGRIWDSALTEPTTWDLMTVDFGAASTGLASGKAGVFIDNNSSGQSIKMAGYTSSPVTVTAGSWSALGALTPGRLNYTLSGSIANVQDLLLEKADGSFWLLLWQRVASWDAGTKTDITNGTVSVSIATSSTHNWTLYTPSAGATGAVIGSATSSVTVNVPDELIILKIS